MTTNQQSLPQRAYELYKAEGYVSIPLLQQRLNVSKAMAVHLKRIVLQRINVDGDDK